MTASNIDAMRAFLQAGPKCFGKVCKANTVFAVVSDDVIKPACGDHLSAAVREVAYQYSPPVSSVQVFWKP